MPLTTLADGSHVFELPQQQNVGIDLDSFLNPRASLASIPPLQPVEYWEQPLGSDFPGMSQFQLTINEWGGKFRQDGYLQTDAIDFAEGDLIIDKAGIGRLPFLVTQFTGSLPTVKTGGRLFGTMFIGIPVMVMPDTTGNPLYKDTGTGYDASIGNVTGYTRPAGASFPMCVEAIQVNGSPYLAIGYDAGTLYSLEVLANLNNPPTSSLVPIGAFTTYGVCQTPVDGDALQVYTQDANGGIIKRINTNVAFGSAVVQSGVRIPPGGYTVGMVSFGYSPEVIYCVPTNGVSTLEGFATTWTQTTFRGKLVRVDMRAYTVEDMDISLPFVLYATKTKYGIFYCDGTSHQYMTKGADIPVDPASDRPLINTKHKRLCRGHWGSQTGDKVFWEEIEYDTGAADATTITRFEYDIYRNRAAPISRTITLGGAGIRAMSSPRLPFSPTNNNLISMTDAAWHYQYQPPRGELGYGKRHTDGTNVGVAGPLFEPSAYRKTAVLRSKGRPGAVFVVSQIIAPPLSHINTGSGLENAGYGYEQTYMTVDVTNTPQALFRGSDDPLDRQMSQEYPGNDAWASGLQITVTGYRAGASIGANYQRYTPNVLPVTVRGYVYDRGAPPPSRNWAGWGAGSRR